jgi:putative ABC transport system permease protein
VLAVASVGTVGFFADRVKGALTREANLLLGADLLISADRALPPEFETEARARGLDVAPGIKFNSMVQRAGGDGAVLADVKAVAPGYPLRSAIVLVDAGLPQGRVASGIPARGEAWPDARLAQRLGASVGDTLAIGDATVHIGAIVQSEPEVAQGLLAIGPRLLVNIGDVPAMNLLQPGNRATWRLFVADRGERGALAGYLDWAQRTAKPGQRVESVRDLRPEVGQTLERGEKFLGLAALVAVVLAAVAVALAASRYLRRHLDTAAMLRCFGAPERRVLALFVVQFAVLGALAPVAGVALALAGQQLLVALLGAISTAQLPPPGVVPALVAFATGVLLRCRR